MRKNGVSLQRAKQTSKDLWRIWQSIQDQPQAEVLLGPIIRDQIIEHLRLCGSAPEDFEIDKKAWAEFIRRCPL